MSKLAGLEKSIICNPYEKPMKHWRYDHAARIHKLVKKRRPAGYLVAPASSKSHDEPGVFQPIALVDDIREKVNNWKNSNYPGITGVTRQLLMHWSDVSVRREYRFFFCQLEAIETLIWLVEINSESNTQTVIPTDGGMFQRLCSKMATGTGKTVVMAMLIVWQSLNKLTYPHDKRFSKDILIIAPGLTVKSRLSVLWPPDHRQSYYHLFNILPESMYEKLKHANVIVHNWHFLKPINDKPHTVIRKGIEGDETFAKRVLKHNFKNIIVINDEAHHAWRKLPEINKMSLSPEQKMDEDMATLWMEGLDKLHKSREILWCFDFSATPFMPGKKTANEEILFKWIVSDFSLNDAIESGLVKTPRMPKGDDGKVLKPSDRSKYYHIYDDENVKTDLNGRAEPDKVLPDLVRNAYMILGSDWERKRAELENVGITPVMITVCNSVDTSARVMHFFQNDIYDFGELTNSDKMCRIDTSVLKSERGEIQTAHAESLRNKINTVGQPGEPGEHIQNIVAVQMLSEGWDARNVTHIMGLRAFSSQLLCEQVVGRGLRRMSYQLNKETNLLDEEYVNILGVPFSFLPHEEVNGPPKPEKCKVRVACDPTNAHHEITWPNVARIETVVTPVLKICWKKVKPLNISSKITATVHVAPLLDHNLDIRHASEMSLRESDEELRMQTIVFHTVLDVYSQLSVRDWVEKKHHLFPQIVKIVEKFIVSDKLKIFNLIDELEIRKKLAIMFNMKSVVIHIHKFIEADNAVLKKIIFGDGQKQSSTSDMQPWYSVNKFLYAKKSHINPVVYDSDWERSASIELEDNDRVVSWFKNYKHGLNIKYQYNGKFHDYVPDFIVKLENDIQLILEIKGQKNEQNHQKHKALAEWVETVNVDKRFGRWEWGVAYDPKDVATIIKKNAEIC